MRCFAVSFWFLIILDSEVFFPIPSSLDLLFGYFIQVSSCFTAESAVSRASIRSGHLARRINKARPNSTDINSENRRRGRLRSLKCERKVIPVPNHSIRIIRGNEMNSHITIQRVSFVIPINSTGIKRGPIICYLRLFVG